MNEIDRLRAQVEALVNARNDDVETIRRLKAELAAALVEVKVK